MVSFDTNNLTGWNGERIRLLLYTVLIFKQFKLSLFGLGLIKERKTNIGAIKYFETSGKKSRMGITVITSSSPLVKMPWRWWYNFIKGIIVKNFWCFTWTWVSIIGIRIGQGTTHRDKIFQISMMTLNMSWLVSTSTLSGLPSALSITCNFTHFVFSLAFSSS